MPCLRGEVGWSAPSALVGVGRQPRTPIPTPRLALPTAQTLAQVLTPQPLHPSASLGADLAASALAEYPKS